MKRRLLREDMNKVIDLLKKITKRLEAIEKVIKQGGN